MTLDNFLQIGNKSNFMKFYINKSVRNTIAFVFVFAIISCVRDEQEQRCFNLVNSTNREINFKLFNNSDDLILEFERAAEGLFNRSCASSLGSVLVTDVYPGDSIVVEFDQQRRLIFAQGQDNPRNIIFFVNEWIKDGSDSFWYFTEEDFNNAEPF